MKETTPLTERVRDLESNVEKIELPIIDLCGRPNKSLNILKLLNQISYIYTEVQRGIYETKDGRATIASLYYSPEFSSGFLILETEPSTPKPDPTVRSSYSLRFC